MLAVLMAVAVAAVLVAVVAAVAVVTAAARAGAWRWLQLAWWSSTKSSLAMSWIWSCEPACVMCNLLH